MHKESGRIVYAVMAFGGFLGVHRRTHMIPWEHLHYDTALKGYAIEITAHNISDAPVLHGDDGVWPDRQRAREVDDFWSPRQWGY
jgi:hypothetical protein